MWPAWDRFDICEAYAVLEWDWHAGGWLQERPSNVRRGRRTGHTGEATSIQLARIHFRPRPDLRYETLTDNGRAIYDAAVMRWGLRTVTCPECGAPMQIERCCTIEEPVYRWGRPVPRQRLGAAALCTRCECCLELTRLQLQALTT